MSKRAYPTSTLTVFAAAALLLSGCGGAGVRPSTDATLSALVLRAGMLTPAFDADTPGAAYVIR